MHCSLAKIKLLKTKNWTQALHAKNPMNNRIYVYRHQKRQNWKILEKTGWKFISPSLTKKVWHCRRALPIHLFLESITSSTLIHPRKRTNVPSKRDYLNREYIFQPLIFRRHVSFQGSNQSRFIIFAKILVMRNNCGSAEFSRTDCRKGPISSGSGGKNTTIRRNNGGFWSLFASWKLLLL